MNDRQVKATLHVKEFKTLTNTQYQAINAVSKVTASRDLQLLIEKKILKNTGTMDAGAEYILIGS